MADTPAKFLVEDGMMRPTGGAVRLRILLANERHDRLDLLAEVIAGMGHDVVGRETDVRMVGALTARVRPDVAIVGLGDSSQHALDHVSAIVREAYCPVIAILATHDPTWVAEASKRGLFAYLLDERPDELQSAVDITLGRFSDYQALQGAFEHRAREAARETELAEDKRRQTLELHDDVVQGLVVAQLALDLGRQDEVRVAVRSTLERARGIVARDLSELEAGGLGLVPVITGRGPRR